MHEFSIARSIVEIAEEAVAERGGRAVERIELNIGRLSGIELDALHFVWDSATADSVLEGAEKIIRRIPAKARCLDCGQAFSPADLLDLCPECGSYFFDLINGKELQVKSLTIVK